MDLIMLVWILLKNTKKIKEAQIKDLINKIKSIPHHYLVFAIGLMLTVLIIVTTK